MISQTTDREKVLAKAYNQLRVGRLIDEKKKKISSQDVRYIYLSRKREKKGWGGGGDRGW